MQCFKRSQARLWMMSWLGLALLLPLWGCPKKVSVNRDLLCQKGDGVNCLTTPNRPSSGQTVSLPDYDINGGPVTCWRFHEKNKPVGFFLTGQTNNPLTAPLLHAFYYDMYAHASRSDVLGAGYVGIVHPAGRNASGRFLEAVEKWDDIFKHLADAGWVKLRNVDAIEHKKRLKKIQKDIKTFYTSSSSRTILYYPANKKDTPLFLPVYAIKNDIYGVQATFPAKYLPPARVQVLGRIYYQQRYQIAKPYMQAIWPMYRKNIREAQQIHELRFKCKHKWNRLFHVFNSRIAKTGFQLSRTMQRIGDPTDTRLQYCNAKNLKQFRASKVMQSKIRTYRKKIDNLNEAFRELVEIYSRGLNSTESTKALNLSTFVDAYLRGSFLHYSAPVSTKKKLIYPQTLVRSWMGSARKRIWRALHKNLKRQGHHIQWDKRLGGILHRPYTYFRVRQQGTDYLVRPYHIIGGSFAILLDRANSMIQVLTPHQQQRKAGIRVKTVAKTKAATTATPTASAKANTPSLKQSSKARKPPPFFQEDTAFYKSSQPPQRSFALTQKPLYALKQRRQNPKRTLLQLIKQPCPENAPTTPVYHKSVEELPSPMPKVPARSFRIEQKFFWMRLRCFVFAIPVKGQTQVPRRLLKGLAREVEREMLQRDYVPSHITIESIQPPKLRFHNKH